MWIWILTACSTQFVFDEPTCDVDYVDWAGGLTYDVLQGEGDGAFRYTPERNDVVAEVEGLYDLRSGEFDWTRSYAADAYRISEQAEGSGTLWPDGDLDLGYELTLELGDRTERLDVRDVRLGCEVERRVEDERGRVDLYSGRIRSNKIVYTHEFVDGSRVLEADGERKRNGTWLEVLDYSDAEITYELEETGDLRDWSWRRDLRYESPEASFDGFYRRRPNGRLSVSYVARVGTNVPELWDYVLDVEGNGSGTVQFEGIPGTCEITFDEGACRIEGCGTDGPCTPPLRTEEVLLRL